MKCISLWQPWATAIALGSKTIETRHWPTNYRGPLAIHAAKRVNLSELEDIAMEPAWMAALHPIYIKLGGLFENPRTLRAELPLGAIVATCNLVDCRPSESFSEDELCAFRYAPDESGFCWNHHDMGNFETGRFGWVLENIQALPVPIPWCGSQGFFDVSDKLLEAAFLAVTNG